MAVAPRVSARVRAARAGRLARESELRRLQLQRSREELVASISHELRTPLTSVVGYAEVLVGGDAGELSCEQLAMMTKIVANADRLHQLVEGLLGAASERTSWGGPVDVAEVVLQVVGGPALLP